MVVAPAGVRPVSGLPEEQPGADQVPAQDPADRAACGGSCPSRQGDLVAAGGNAGAVTSRPTFRDFAVAARTYLDHAVPPAADHKAPEAAARTRQTVALTASPPGVVEVNARYLADITAPVAGVCRRDGALLSPWVRAGIEAQDALGQRGGV